MQILAPKDGYVGKCTVCGKTSNEVLLYYPSPRKDADPEWEKVRSYAKCEYCLFGIPAKG